MGQLTRALEEPRLMFSKKLLCSRRESLFCEKIKFLLLLSAKLHTTTMSSVG
jgi:hypothetical protein